MFSADSSLFSAAHDNNSLTPVSSAELEPTSPTTAKTQGQHHQSQSRKQKAPSRNVSFHDPHNYLRGFQASAQKSRLRMRLSREFDSLQSDMPFLKSF